MGGQHPWCTHSGLSVQCTYFLLSLIRKAFICRYSQVSFPTWRSEKQTCVLEMGLWLCFANKAWLTFTESPTMPFFFTQLSKNKSKYKGFWLHFLKGFPQLSYSYLAVFPPFFLFLLRSHISMKHSECLIRKINCFHRSEKSMAYFLLGCKI